MNRTVQCVECPLYRGFRAPMHKSLCNNRGHFLGAREIEAVIPPKPAPECSYRGSNRTEAIDYDKEKYERREKVERFFNKLKQFRRIATRYEKLGRTFMAFINITSTWIMLR